MKEIFKILFFLISLILFLPYDNFGQACCTAGTPLLGSLELVSAPKGTLQFGLNYEHNSLSDVFSGTEKLKNNERERISRSILLEINYGITKRISITSLFSYNSQSRTIFESENLENNLKSSGIGDFALLVKYSIIPFDIIGNQEFSIGLGLKIPTGSSNLKSNGILIPADMQPGSGSWDGLLWAYYRKSNFVIPTLTLLSNISFRLNGSNNRFEQSSSGYSFGDEIIGLLGITHPIIEDIEVTILSKFRKTSKDIFGNNQIPNTGGEWIYLNPGLSYFLSNNTSIRIDSEIPIYRNVLGTQLTTSYTTSISFFYSFRINEGKL